jgi:hypothetical protein
MRALLFLACLLAAGGALAQKPSPAELAALSHVQSALLTGADAGVMKREIALGPELQRRLVMPARAPGAKVYEAVIQLFGSRAPDVRRTTAAEIASYGARPGFEPIAQVPLTAEAGEVRILLQYDPQASAISYVGELGVDAPAPAPAPAAKPKPKPKPKAS